MFINERERLTIEELVADCLDVRELQWKGLLKFEHWRFDFLRDGECEELEHPAMDRQIG